MKGRIVSICLVVAAIAVFLTAVSYLEGTLKLIDVVLPFESRRKRRNWVWICRSTAKARIATTDD